MKRRLVSWVVIALMLLAVPCLAADGDAPAADQPGADEAAQEDVGPADVGQEHEGAVPLEQPAAEPAGEPLLLRLKYTKGEKLTYRTNVEGVGSVHVMGQSQAIDMSGELQTVVSVEDVDEEGKFTLLTSVDVSDLTVTMSGQAVPRPNQNMRIRTVMTPRGEIADFEMLQEPTAAGQQSPWNARMARIMTGGLDLKRLLMDQKVATFPEEPVTVGAEWSGTARPIEVEGTERPLTITTRYDGDIELEGRECVRLDSTTTVQSEALGELAQMLGMKGSTTTNTRTWFDPEAGRRVASMERTQVEMRAALPAELTGAAEPTEIFLEMFVEATTRLMPPAEQ
ncbi:MAG: hypothetical protein U9R79_04285 [Armatimonadota bacterium]|nr:hypothetical protein [Armatimonadota bacterium]